MPCTEEHSRELKSSSDRGLETEGLVLKFLIQKKFKLVEQRYKTPFGEVDLLLDSPKNHLVMIEVKSLSSWDRLLHRLSAKQRQRLHRSRQFLENKYRRLVVLKVAYVGPKNEIVFLDT